MNVKFKEYSKVNSPVSISTYMCRLTTFVRHRSALPAITCCTLACWILSRTVALSSTNTPVLVCAERCCSRPGRVPPAPPAQLYRILGGGDRGSLLWRRARDRLHTWRRSRQSLPSRGGGPAEARDRVLPRWRMGPRQCTWVNLQLQVSR